MKNLYQITRHLVWLTQFGLSVALPPVLFLLGAVWLKNERIRDSQYRFNKTAATAVKAAIEASRPRRKAWEAANESDVTRRARALQAKKAASGKARRTPAKKR